jgi:hypothetical protein
MRLHCRVAPGEHSGWRFGDAERRTIHHQTGNAFFATGPRLEARRID